MGYKGVLMVAVCMVIAFRRVLAWSCTPCHGRGPHDRYPNGTVQNNCRPKPTCSHGYTSARCDCGCYNKCAKGPGEPCSRSRVHGGCGDGLQCGAPWTPGGYWYSGSICVPETPQDPCSPGLELFKHQYVYGSSDSVFTTENAKDFARIKGDLWKQVRTSDQEGSLAAVTTVYDGRNITYHLHPSGESCYTNFVKSYKCLGSPDFRYSNQNITCERDEDGPYCAALFRRDIGLYEEDICQDTPELRTTVHPLARSTNPCSTGIVFFKQRHVYDRSNSVLNTKIAKMFTDSLSEPFPARNGLSNKYPVYDGRNMTYHLHHAGESCYTNFVKSYRCSDLQENKNYLNSTCERDQDGPYCAALFRIDSGLYGGDFCRDTPELGNTVHPLAISPDGSACSLPWFRIRDQCFLLVGAAYPNKSDWRNWASADDYCRSQVPSCALAHPSASPQASGGAALAQPKPYNVKPLSDYIKSKGYSDSWDTFWLAGSDFNQKVVRRWWSDGTNITTGWQRGEPNSDNGEDCLGIGPMGADSLIVMGCEGVWPFVCEA